MRNYFKKYFCYKRIINSFKSLRFRIRAKREVKHAFSNPNIPPVLVYSMGKVGSSTVHHSLIDVSLPNPILHVHFLSYDLTYHRKFHERIGFYPPPYHIYLGEEIRKVLKKNKCIGIKIISLFRDPIAFVISDLFQNPYFSRESITNGGGRIEPQKVINYLEREFCKPDTFKYIFEWFDRELKSVFDIDIFAAPFPKDIGYKVYLRNNITALVIRLENLSIEGVKAISEFMNIDPPLGLRESNVRELSQDSNSYQEVLNSICLSSTLCKNIYSSRFVKHLYHTKMINKFIEKWTNNSKYGLLYSS